MLTADIEALVRNTARDNIIGLQSFKKDELLMYINSAAKWIVSMDSTASVVTEAIPLAQGTHQSLPNEGIRVLEFWNNDSGTKRERIDSRLYKGRDAVREVPLSEMRSTVPQWGSARETTIAVNVIFNKDDPTHFMVYPPNKGDGKIIATYAKTPEKVTDLTASTELKLPEIYLNSVANYVLYKMMIRSDEGMGEKQADSQKADYFYMKAVQTLQGKEAADQTSTPASTADM